MTSSSATEATELVDMDTPSHALRTDSTLSLEQALTKPLLQDSTTDAALATTISAAAGVSRIKIWHLVDHWAVILSVLETVGQLGLPWETLAIPRLVWYIEIMVTWGRLRKASLSWSNHKKFLWDEAGANLGVCWAILLALAAWANDLALGLGLEAKGTGGSPFWGWAGLEVICYDSMPKVLSKELTLVLSDTRELDRVHSTK